MIAAALDYAAQGLPVFPCLPHSKEPATRNGFKAATTNPATIRRLWLQQDRNIAVATGAASNVWVLDVDGDQGRQALRELEAQHGPLPPTVTVESGSGGFHLWFKYVGLVTCSVSRVGAKIDAKGDGGYVVLPPSIHPNGNPYRWVTPFARDRLAIAPGWLMTLTRKPTISQQALATIRPANVAVVHGYGLAALKREADAVAAAPSGSRNSSLNVSAFRLGQLVGGGELTAHQVQEALVKACERNGLVEDDGLQSVLKTIRSAAIRDPRKSVLVLAHRREIIGQTSEKLFAAGVSHGIIQSGFTPRPLMPVQVASIQTLWRRSGGATANLPSADLLVIDEGHHCPARTYLKIIEAYPDAVLLAPTATPCRGDGRGLGGIFEIMLECPQVAELQAGGYLVTARVYAPVDPDLTGVRTKLGDYVERELADRMDRPKLIGGIVEHWFKFGERRRTVCFASSVGHSIHIKDEFVKSGVRAEHIDGTTPKPERDATLSRLASGEIEVVTNCMVLTEGWNLPAVGCCILARPTKLMGLYRQMIGRVLRPAPDKPDAIILDHSGAVFRHGLPDDPVEWSLDPDRRATSPKHENRTKRGDGSRLLECSQCLAVRVAGEACGVCGFLPQRPPQPFSVTPGELGLVDQTRQAKAQSYDADDRQRWHAMLIGIGNERGYAPGWSAHKYKEKFGQWPPWHRPEPITPTPEVRSWVRSRMIAYAKRRA